MRSVMFESPLANNLVTSPGRWYLKPRVLEGASGRTQLQGETSGLDPGLRSPGPPPIHSPPTGQTAGLGRRWGREAVCPCSLVGEAGDRD